MRKYMVYVLILLAIIVTITRWQDNQALQTSQTNNDQEFIKAVHYFSSSWPKSFWEDFEHSQVDDEFAQIKADGFNTVILVVPWMGFETGFEDGLPEPSHLYDRLEWLLGKIEKAELSYGLRVGFPHNFDPENGVRVGRLCMDMFSSDSLYKHWVNYLARIAQRVDRHRDGFKFAFFSWEDFFCTYGTIPYLENERRLDMAKRSGYQTWLAENFELQHLETSYARSFESIGDIPFPERKSPGFWLFLRFVDQFLVNQLLTPGRQVLPELAMEVRVDKDAVHKGGEMTWAGHDLALTDDRLRGSYWGAYYGARNQGELLLADQALRHFDQMLNEVSDNGKNINHVVEQFNFADNTPGYAGRHAQIRADELPAFLQGAAALLREKSRGYGLWTYRDYVDSAIYNGSFELGLRGWDANGQLAPLTNTDGDQALLMQAGAEISQSFAPFDRFAGLGNNEQVTFCANFTRLAAPAHIRILFNGSRMGTLDVDETAEHCVAMDAQAIKQAAVVFTISTDAEIQIDDLRLYSYVQVLDVYDKNGQPGPLRDLIVRLNTVWLAD
jgi:hypothetical protein